MSQRLPRFYRQQQLREDLLKVNKILSEAGPDEIAAKVTHGTASGDERKLRGLPAVGRGVSGTVPGTDPLRALLAKDGQRRK